MTATPSSQCLTCKKRQVKCDSTRPGCHRCEADGRKCSGYKQFKVIQYRGPENGKRLRSRPEQEPFARTNLHDTPSITHVSVGGDIPVLLDSVTYYNTFVVPRLAPAYPPFERELVPSQVIWQALPKILRHVMVATLRSYQVGPNHFNPLSQPELCHHRGQALRELQTSLEDAVRDPSGMALAVVLMLIGGDMLIASDAGCWTTHLEAARMLIRARHGFVKCMSSLPTSRTLLLTFAIVDIMTMVTCGMGSTSFASAQEQQGFAETFPDWERQIMANITPCPVPVLIALARVNMLRACEWAFGRCESEAAKAGQILASLEAFDAPAWAARVLRFGQLQPQRVEDTATDEVLEAMTSLAQCYRAGASVYLLLSCPVDDGSSGEKLSIALQTLSSNSDRLFNTARNDFKAPLESQLWKMIKWPLIISAYVKIAWNLGSHTNASYGELLRLQTVATRLGSRQLTEVANELRRHYKQSIAEPSTSRTWDDGFDYRWTFIP